MRNSRGFVAVGWLWVLVLGGCDGSEMTSDAAVENDASTSDASTSDAATPDASTSADGGDASTASDGGPAADGGPDGSPVACDDEPVVRYAASGLPLLESNPGAPLALYLDFDGGTYFSSSSGESSFGGYSRDGDFATFNAAEQEDIVASWTHVSRYFAMFDVNVTTDDEVRLASAAWAWTLVSEEISGGRASTSSSAIGRNPYARARVGSSTVRIGDSDRSRRIAHEIGHNFTLEHSGTWSSGTFYKWEDWPAWDHVYGPIMGGGGEGDRNGWSLGHHEGDPTTMQDTMAVIHQRVIDIAGSSTGWRVDDFGDTDAEASVLCAGAGRVYRRGILERPDDVDVFVLLWGGGDLTVEGVAVGVSAALVDVDVVDASGEVIGSTGTIGSVAPGRYTMRVRSQGGYGEIGVYEVSAR